jgi:hypothetical protein
VENTFLKRYSIAFCAAITLTIKASAADTVDASIFLKLSGVTITPSAGWVEWLNIGPDLNITTGGTLDVVNGVRSATSFLEQTGSTDFKFIIHPDSSHQNGDLVLAAVGFSAQGYTESVNASLASVGAVGDMQLFLGASSGPYPIVSSFNYSTFLGTRYDDPNFRDEVNFRLTGLGSQGFAFGNTYDLDVYGDVRGAILHPPDSVPENSGCLWLLGGLTTLAFLKRVRNQSCLPCN